MKKLIVIVGLIVLTTNVFAQSVDLRRKIEVEGIASKEVTPDIINITITLKEYKAGNRIVSISKLEGQLEKAVREAGVSKDDFTINDVWTYNYDDEKKKASDFLASKQYGIRFHDFSKYNELLSKLDPKGIETTDIASYDHSKIAEFKKELKIQALLAAKNKAAYLLEALGEKLGAVINIGEGLNTFNGGSVGYYGYSNTITVAEKGVSSDINTRRIKLSFSIHATFEIK